MKAIILATLGGIIACVVSCNLNDPSKATYPWGPTPVWVQSHPDAGHDSGVDASVDASVK